MLHILKSPIVFVVLIFGFAATANAKVDAQGVLGCMKRSRCAASNNLGTIRSSDIEERCRPGRSIFSCHLVNNAMDLVIPNTPSCFNRLKICSTQNGGGGMVKKYDTRGKEIRVHVGPESCRAEVEKKFPLRGAKLQRCMRRLRGASSEVDEHGPDPEDPSEMEEFFMETIQKENATPVEA